MSEKVPVKNSMLYGIKNYWLKKKKNFLWQKNVGQKGKINSFVIDVTFKKNGNIIQ